MSRDSEDHAVVCAAIDLQDNGIFDHCGMRESINSTSTLGGGRYQDEVIEDGNLIIRSDVFIDRTNMVVNP